MSEADNKAIHTNPNMFSVMSDIEDLTRFRALSIKDKLHNVRLHDQFQPLSFYRAGQDQGKPVDSHLLNILDILVDALLQPQPELEGQPTVQHDMGEFLRARSTEGSAMRQYAQSLLTACADTYVEPPVRSQVMLSPVFNSGHTGILKTPTAV